MKMTQKCEKFYVDEESVYYLSGIDGSLFITDIEDFFNNDQYCFDYFQIGNDTMTVMMHKIL
jgi:hypothetical protein